MRLELDAHELELMIALLDAAIRERLHQIHHADSRDYRERLKQEVRLIEGVRAKLGAKAAAA
jgi:hypothetical protein